MAEKDLLVECLMTEGGKLRGYGTFFAGDTVELPADFAKTLCEQQPHHWRLVKHSKPIEKKA